MKRKIVFAVSLSVLLCVLLGPGCGGDGGGGGAPAPGGQPSGQIQYDGESAAGLLAGLFDVGAYPVYAGQFALETGEEFIGGSEKALTKAGPPACVGVDVKALLPKSMQVTLTFNSCEFLEDEDGEQVRVRLNGTLSGTATDPDYSGTDPIDDPDFEATIFDLQFTNFSYRKELVSGGRLKEDISADLALHFEPPDGLPGTASFTATGWMEVESSDLSEEGPKHFRIEYQDFSGTAQVNAEEDVESIVVNGTVRFRNFLCPAPDNEVTVTLDDFTVTMEEVPGGTEFTFNGHLTGTCVGDVVVETQEPFFVPEDGTCPTGGVVVVSAASDGTRLCEIRPQSDGSIVIHDSGSGEDRTVPSCRDFSFCGG